MRRVKATKIEIVASSDVVIWNCNKQWCDDLKLWQAVTWWTEIVTSSDVVKSLPDNQSLNFSIELTVNKEEQDLDINMSERNLPMGLHPCNVKIWVRSRMFDSLTDLDCHLAMEGSHSFVKWAIFDYNSSKVLVYYSFTPIYLCIFRRIDNTIYFRRNNNTTLYTVMFSNAIVIGFFFWMWNRIRKK